MYLQEPYVMKEMKSVQVIVDVLEFNVVQQFLLLVEMVSVLYMRVVAVVLKIEVNVQVILLNLYVKQMILDSVVILTIVVDMYINVCMD